MKFKNQIVLLKYSLHSNPRSMNSFHFRHKPSSKDPVEILNSGVPIVIDCLFFMFSFRNPQTPVGRGAKSLSVTPYNGASVIHCASSIFMFIKIRFELTKNGNVKNDNAGKDSSCLNNPINSDKIRIIRTKSEMYIGARSCSASLDTISPVSNPSNIKTMLK